MNRATRKINKKMYVLDKYINCQLGFFFIDNATYKIFNKYIEHLLSNNRIKIMLFNIYIYDSLQAFKTIILSSMTV